MFEPTNQAVEPLWQVILQACLGVPTNLHKIFLRVQRAR